MSSSSPPNTISFKEIFEKAYVPKVSSPYDANWNDSVSKVLFQESSAYFKAKKFKLTKDLFFNSSYVRSKKYITLLGYDEYLLV